LSDRYASLTAWNHLAFIARWAVIWKFTVKTFYTSLIRHKLYSLIRYITCNKNTKSLSSKSLFGKRSSFLRGKIRVSKTITWNVLYNKCSCHSNWKNEHRDDDYSKTINVIARPVCLTTTDRKWGRCPWNGMSKYWVSSVNSMLYPSFVPVLLRLKVAQQ